MNQTLKRLTRRHRQLVNEKVSIQNRMDNTLILSLGKSALVPDVVNFLVQRNVRIEQVKRREASLEEIYTVILKEREQ